MSKEMAVILLGVWVIVATQLGIPSHPWLTIVFALSGLAIVIVGFLLRADALTRGGSRSQHHTFVENLPDRQAGQPTDAVSSQPHMHDHKERITSLN